MTQVQATDLLQEANKYKDHGQYDLALDLYQKLLEIDPNLVEVYANMAEIHSALGEWDKSLSFYQQTVALKPNFGWYHYNVGRCLAEMSQWDEAIVCYRQAIELDPNLSWSYYGLGDVSVKQEKWDEAIGYYEKFIQLNQTEYLCYHKKGDALNKLDRWDEARESYKMAIELNPSFSWSYNNLADVLMKQEIWEDARLNYVKAIELNPDFFWSYQNLGMVLLKLKRWDEAIEISQKAIKIDGTVKEAYYNLADAMFEKEKHAEIYVNRAEISVNNDRAESYFKMGEELATKFDWEEAINSYQQAINLALDCFKYHQRLGEAFHAYGKIDEAINQYNLSLKVHTHQGQKLSELENLYFNLGEAFQRKRQFEEAISAYQKSLEINGNSAKVYHHLGVALSDVNKEDAIVAFRQAVTVDPNYFWSYHQQGTLLNSLQRWEESLVSFCQCLAIDPTVPSLHSNIGEILVHLDQWELALNHLQTAKEANPNAGEIYYYLGAVLAKKNQLEQAIKSFSQAITIKPGLAWFHQLMGEYLAKLGCLDLGVLAYEQAVWQQEKSVKDYFYLALILTLQGKIEKAIKAYQQAIKLDPQYRECYFNLTWLLSQTNRWDEAINIYQNTDQYQTVGLHELLDKFRINSKYTFIKLHSLTQTDQQFLENIGLSISNLFQIEQDNIAWKEAYPKIFDYTPDLPAKKFSIPAFIQETVAQGYMQTVCPFTGVNVKTDQSFTFSASSEICYYFSSGQEKFYLITGNWHIFKMAIYLPEREIIISFCDDKNGTMAGWQREQIENIVNTLKSYICYGLNLVKTYVLDDQPKKIAAHVANTGNIGHYFWNQVSAFQELYESRQLSKIKAWLIGPHNYLDIRDIFPEITTENLADFFDIDANYPGYNVFELCLKNNLFSLVLSNLLVTERSANRLYHRSFFKCSQDFLATVGTAKKHFPLIWITIRTSRRLWINQVEGIANIVQEIYKDYPNMGIVFDGIPTERVHLDRILELLPASIKTYEAIDCKAYESIVWGHAIDLFIVGYGAALIFPCQIANKPGVIHAHKYQLKSEPFCLNPRENCVPIFPVSKDAIDDVLDGDYHNPHHRNYYCDWRAIYQEAIKLIKNLDTSNY